MEDLAARGTPLEYWFFRTASEDLSILVDVIARRADARAETRVAFRVGDIATVERVYSDTWTGDLQGIRAGDNLVTATTTQGQVGDITWSLAIDLGPDKILPLPPALAWLRPFDMQIVSRPTASFTGSVAIGDREWAFTARPGMVSHYWGRALPQRWTWLSVTGEPTSPRLESTVLRSRLWGLPVTITCGYFWRSGEPPSSGPVLTVMPLNGVVRATRARTSARVRAWRPPRLRAELGCSAADESFVELGEGIRQSLAAEVTLGDRRLPAALEFRN
jgi:hypothetical protein